MRLPVDYIAEYRRLHQSPSFCKGGAIASHIGAIRELIRKTGAKSVLDYGSGKALLSRSTNWGVPVTYYDPGIPEFDQKPIGQFDGVICTDVLEHVENPEVVIAEVLGYARKFVFVSVSCQESHPKQPKFSDGSSLHISVHPPQWWRDRIKTDLLLDLRFDVPG